MNPIYWVAITQSAVPSLTCECRCCHSRWMIPEGQCFFTLRCAYCGTPFTQWEDRENLGLGRETPGLASGTEEKAGGL